MSRQCCLCTEYNLVYTFHHCRLVEEEWVPICTPQYKNLRKIFRGWESQIHQAKGNVKRKIFWF